MRSITNILHWIRIQKFILLLVLLFPAPDLIAEEYAIFVHKSIPIQEISTANLSRLFLSESTNIGSIKLYPVNLASDYLKLPFYETLTGMSRDRVAFHFVESELRGEGTWPREVLSELEMIKMILVSRRIIAWMIWDQFQGLNDTVRKNLKLVSVDGHLPGETGYPLVSQ